MDTRGGENLGKRVFAFFFRRHSCATGTRPSVRWPCAPDWNRTLAAARRQRSLQTRCQTDNALKNSRYKVQHRGCAGACSQMMDWMLGLVTPVASSMHRLCYVVFARQHTTSDDPVSTRERLFHHAHMTLTVCARGVLSGWRAAVFNSSSVCAWTLLDAAPQRTRPGTAAQLLKRSALRAGEAADR